MTPTLQTAMNDCPFIERCPMFPLFQLDGVRRIYQSKYCQADFQACQRYQKASKGNMPDPRLLPDGRMLPGNVQIPPRSEAP